MLGIQHPSAKGRIGPERCTWSPQPLVLPQLDAIQSVVGASSRSSTDWMSGSLSSSARAIRCFGGFGEALARGKLEQHPGDRPVAINDPAVLALEDQGALGIGAKASLLEAEGNGGIRTMLEDVIGKGPIAQGRLVID